MAALRPWSPQIYTDVVRAYGNHSVREVDRVKRNLFGLSDDDKAELIWKPEDQVGKMKDAVCANLAFLAKLSEAIQKAPALQGGDAPTGVKPVQTLLQTLTREWSAEGAEERRECFERLLGALDSHLQAKAEEAATAGTARPRVLCPGASLGRLAFEVQQRGYESVGCEARVLNYFTCEFIRQQGATPEAHRIQPYALSTCNRFRREDHIRPTPVPDVAIEGSAFPQVRFGDFTRLYDEATERGAFDAVLTAFAVDSSPNIFRFVRTVAHVLRPGGVWANFGPLAYDTDHDEGHGHGVELSWEELRHAVSHFFDVKEEDFVDAFDAANAESMMQIQYNCVFFKAVRNSTPAVGIGGTPAAS
uniref:carnosine N-methyltransferase n=1 Tax=Zooxanthella nutricula TaxID=1333877 RepID=A0A6U8XGW3_9DINO|mmetsp:Transcript_97935/g.299309  ORF Transcript_97935/g.299309 Transcript_97935/m.299309 type:complete len:361 (+) Transcript_97935:86-1168(+)